VQLRASRRAMLRRASRCVSELNGELQRLVPDFGKPIAGHVNFALVEVLVRALGWRHSSLMRDLMYSGAGVNHRGYTSVQLIPQCMPSREHLGE